MRMKSRSTIASFSRWIESVEEIRSNRQLLRRLLSNLSKTKGISVCGKNTIKYENLMKSRRSFLKLVSRKQYKAFTAFGFQQLKKLYRRDVKRYICIKRFCRIVRYSVLMKGFKRWHMAALTVGFYTERRRIMVRYEKVLAISRWQLLTGMAAREEMYERENGILRRQVQNMIYKLQLRMPGNLPRHKTLLELRLRELSSIQKKLEQYRRPFFKWQKWDSGLLEKKDESETDVLDLSSLDLYVKSRFDDTLVLTPPKKANLLRKQNIKKSCTPLKSSGRKKTLTLQDLKEKGNQKSLLALSPVGTEMRKLQDEVYQSALRHSRESFKRLGGKKAWH